MDSLRTNVFEKLLGDRREQQCAVHGRGGESTPNSHLFSSATGRISRLLLIACCIVGISLVSSTGAAAAGASQEGSDKCAGVEVMLKFPRSETIARALEVTRALQSSGDVLRVRYGVADGENASAEILHCPETTAEVLKRIVDTLSAASIEDVKVKLYEPSCA